MIGTTHQVLVNHRTSNANKQHSNGTDDDYQDDHGMRVGANYQAEIPQFIAYAPAPPYYEEEKAILVWSPNNNIPEHVLIEYINKAKEKFYYTCDQALGMLSWHKFDLNRAYADLPNFVPYPNDWSIEDKVLFEQAHQFHQKQFNKIKQMLPDKTMASLINYYYSWKKTRTRAGLMERQSRRLAARKANDSNAASDADDDDDEIEDEDRVVDDDEVVENRENQSQTTSTNVPEAGVDERGQESDDNQNKEESFDKNISCCACRETLSVNGKPQAVIIDGIFDNFCIECFFKWKEGGKELEIEPEYGDCYYQPKGGSKSKLFTYEDVMSLVNGPPEAGDAMIKHLDTQIQDVRRDIQTAKQTISSIVDKIRPIDEQISNLNLKELSNIILDYNPTKIWSQEETCLVVQGLRRYGTDFSAIADVIRTKTADSIRNFYVSQKDRLGLDRLVAQYEQEYPSKTETKSESSSLRVSSINTNK